MKTTILALIMACLCIPMWSQTCSISPSQPQPALPGQCVQFTAQGCRSEVWTLTGPGTLDQSGRYCAPSTVYAENYTKGMQVVPNSNAINAPVNNWPAFPHRRWLDRVATDAPTQSSCHNFKLTSPPRFFEGLYVNPVDDSTPLQRVHAHYPWPASLQDTLMPFSQPPFLHIQSGAGMDVYGATNGGTGPDRHFFECNPAEAKCYEFYQVVVDSHNYAWRTTGVAVIVDFDTNVIRGQIPTPLRVNVNGATGACAGMNFNGYPYSSFLATVVSQTPAENGYAQHLQISIPYNAAGCSPGNFASATLATSGTNDRLMNVGSMSTTSATDNSAYGGTDAAGTSFIATSGDPQQWYSNVVNNVGDPNCNGCVTGPRHALRTTLGNQMLRADVMMPATNYAAGGHPRMQLASCTPTNPVVCKSNYNLATQGLAACEAPTPWLAVSPSNCPNFHVAFVGMTGVGAGWATLQDDIYHKNSFAATAVTDTYHFTIPVDGRNFGAGSWNGNQYIMFDWAPYGTRIRLKASFNVESFCSDTLPECKFTKAYLRSLQVYGMIIADGTVPSDDWDTAMLTNGFAPPELVETAYDLHSWYPIEQYFEVVDPTGSEPYWTPTGAGVANNQENTSIYNRVQICVGGTACADVNVQGTAIGIDPESILIPGGGTFTPKVIVTGTQSPDYSCTFSQPIPGASVSSDGTITAPADSAMTQTVNGQVVCSVDAAPQAKAYLDVYSTPHDSDGALRLLFGHLKPTYTDLSGKVWYAGLDHGSGNGQYSAQGWAWEVPGLTYGPMYPSWNMFRNNWGSYPDGELYGSGVSHKNDITFTTPLPNGSYTVTLVGEAGAETGGVGCNVFDVEINGSIRASWMDGWLLAGGAYRGYSKDFSATVTDNMLHFIARDRQDSSCSPLGMSITGLKITQSGAQPLQFNPPAQLAAILVGTPYRYQFLASGGVPPYDFTLTQGSLPPGMQLTASGLFTGTPSEIGIYSFTIRACDSTTPQPQCLARTISLTIISPTPALQILTTSLSNGMQGVAYDVLLRGSGGVPPYRWGSSMIMPPGLQLTTAGEIKGTPTQAGAYQLNITLSDSQGSPAATAKLSLTIGQQAAPVITTSSLPDGTVGKAYPVTQLRASGGLLPYRWMLASGPLPPGLLLSGTGSRSR